MGADRYMFSFDNRLIVEKNFVDIYINWKLIITDKLVFDNLSTFYIYNSSTTPPSIKQSKIS